MTTATNPFNSKKKAAFEKTMKTIGLILLVAATYVAVLGILWLAQDGAGQPLAGAVRSLFSVNTVQAWWYVTRAAGLTSYVLLWLSMVWGMAIS